MIFSLMHHHLERVSRDAWDDRWTLMLYGSGSDRREICLYEDLS